MRYTVVAFALLVTCLPARAGGVDQVSVYVTGGKSITNWHGQADVQAVHIELGRARSSRTDLAVVLAPMNVWQPRSWFGDLYGDGSEAVRAVSASLLLRRRFGRDSAPLHWYLEAATGPMYAEKSVPAATSRFNFITQGGGGLIIGPGRRAPVYLGYRFAHISNAGYSPRNPGLNVSSLVIGTRLTIGK